MVKRRRARRLSRVRPRGRLRGRYRSRRNSRARRNGYRSGWEQGYRLGRCRAVLNTVNLDRPFPVHPIRLMYVTSGLGMPYAPLDQVIADTFGEQVGALMVARPFDDIIGIAREFQPNVVVALDGVQMFSPVQLEALRAMGIRTAAWFVDDPYYTDLTTSMAFHYDLVFTIELSCYHLYKDMGHSNVHYLPLGVHPKYFQPMSVSSRYESDICFIGTAFWNRVHFFDAVIPHLRGRKFRIIGLWWNRMRHYRKLRSGIWMNQWLSPEETAKYYNGAKIVVNLHRSSDDMTYNRNSRGVPALSMNPRTFEIAACGAFQLSDMRHDMHNFLQPGHEIETFSSVEQFVDKVNYYLANTDARQTIALRGLKRTMETHTFRNRIAEMLQIITQS
ncbi:spore maturation protein [Insulibacter thermoxylanivorax]|uniref:Spore maturation protein n=1 Tax=Insulibacter thermoxylanivorax TaxID=2749268 RepID=A0A916QE26_9BACL|nr:glycosyltransferase [Insulibacter thermoxylanivorax]GFR39055.1 spore maturation protein [Insulibacter thermoxylanivorax]